MTTAPTSLDPGLVQDSPTIGLLADVYDGLVGYDDHNDIVPRVASKWEIKDGGRIYVFTIRDNAKFQNGRQVTASDVKWTFERNTAKNFPSPTAPDYLSDIVGVKEHSAGSSAVISGLKVLDDHHLQVTLIGPRPYFLGKLTYPCAAILAKEAVGESGTQINSISQAIGAGPFQITDYKPDQQIELSAFSQYYLGKPKVAHVKRPIVKDFATSFNMFRSGNLDFIGLERQDVAAAENDPKLKAQMHSGPLPALYYVGMNQTAYKPFADRRVRMAVAMSIDRNKIANVYLHGLTTANGFLPPGIPGFRPDLKGIPYDPSGARALLAQAGFTSGSQLPTLTMTYRSERPDAEVLAEEVAAMLKDGIGLNVSLQKMDMSAFFATRNRRELQMYLGSWYADYLDPQNFLSLLLTTNASANRDGYSNSTFDALCAQADQEQDRDKRLKLYQQAEDVLLGDAARIPIYVDRDVSLVSSRATGVQFNLFGKLPDFGVSLR
jgi:oligopeptide transport system substrate-binding protein